MSMQKTDGVWIKLHFLNCSAMLLDTIFCGGKLFYKLKPLFGQFILLNEITITFTRTLNHHGRFPFSIEYHSIFIALQRIGILLELCAKNDAFG